MDGMDLDLDVEVPGLPPGRGDVDWHVDVRRLPAPATAGVSWTGEVSYEGTTWGRFGRRRRERWIELAALVTILADPEARRAFLHHPDVPLGEARAVRHSIPYLAALSGRVALHAACAVLGDRAVLACGESTAGKSTLALALDASGVPVLADDHVALREDEGGALLAEPSFPFVEVAQNSRALFRPDAAAEPGKARTSLRTPRPEGPVPVGRLVFLRRGPSLARAPLGEPEAFARLIRDAVFVGDPASSDEHARRFAVLGRLVRDVPAFSLTLPDGLLAFREALPAVRDLLTG